MKNDSNAISYAIIGQVAISVISTFIISLICDKLNGESGLGGLAILIMAIIYGGIICFIYFILLFTFLKLRTANFLIVALLIILMNVDFQFNYGVKDQIANWIFRLLMPL